MTSKFRNCKNISLVDRRTQDVTRPSLSSQLQLLRLCNAQAEYPSIPRVLLRLLIIGPTTEVTARLVSAVFWYTKSTEWHVNKPVAEYFKDTFPDMNSWTTLNRIGPHYKPSNCVK